MDRRDLDRREFMRRLSVVAGAAGSSSVGLWARPVRARPLVPDQVPVAPPTATDGMVAAARARGLTFGCGLTAPGLQDTALLAAHLRGGIL